MKRLACVLVTIGCGTSSRIEPPVHDAATPSSPDAAPRAASIAKPASVPLATIELWQPQLVSPPIRTAAPQTIAVMATADDGGLAVTSDGRATLRLWPTLDGKREPVVLATTVSPARLAVIHDGSDLAIAVADRAGQVEVLRTGALGELHLRVRLDLGQPIMALVPIEGGFIVLRQDQTLVELGPGGAAVSALTPAPGEHVATLSSRHGRVIAATAGDDGARIRRVVPGAALAFGDTSPPLDIDPTRVVLAPGGQRFAAFSRDHKRLAIHDTASGDVVTVIYRFQARPKAPFIRGFVDDDMLVFGSDVGRDLWWRRGVILDGFFGFTAVPSDTCDHQLVVAVNGSLELLEPGKARYLGYHQTMVTSLARDGNGWLIADGTPHVMHVDDRFDLRREVAVTRGDVIVIDAGHLLVQDGGVVSEVELAHLDEPPAVLGKGVAHYQASTGVLLLEAGSLLGSVLDRKTGVFSTPFEIVDQAAGWRLLDPRGKGPVAVALEYVGAANLKVTTVSVGLTEGVPELELDFTYHDVTPGVTITDEALAKLGFAAPTLHHPNRDRSLMAEVGGGRITLRDKHGDVRWSVAHPGAIDVAWGAHDELVAYGSGLARLDPGTGALADRRCGWSFGVIDDRTAFNGTAAALCEEP